MLKAALPCHLDLFAAGKKNGIEFVISLFLTRKTLTSFFAFTLIKSHYTFLTCKMSFTSIVAMVKLFISLLEKRRKSDDNRFAHDKKTYKHKYIFPYLFSLGQFIK